MNSRERFNKRALDAFRFIFRDHDGVVLSNGEDYPDGMDAAAIEIAAGKLKLRILQHRGEYRVDIADRERNLEEWQDISLALRKLDSHRTAPPWNTFEELARIIEKDWLALVKAVTE